MRARLGPLAAGAATLIILLAVPARAETTVRIRSADLGTDGSVRLVVSLGGDTAAAPVPAGVTVTENGRTVGPVQVTPLQPSQQKVSVAIAIDESGSTAGRAIADAKNGAKAFVAALDPAVAVAVVSFADGTRVRTPLTTDRAAVLRGIDAVTAGGSTALYDGLVTAADQIQKAAGIHHIIAFSDGRDTVNRSTVDQAITAAKNASAPIDAVLLTTKDADPASLGRLAQQTRGSLVQVSDSGSLASAFRSVAAEISSQFVVTYNARMLSNEVDIVVAVLGATDAVLVANPRRGVPPAVSASPFQPEAPLVEAFSGRLGLWVGLIAAFAFLALFGGLLTWQTTHSAGRTSLRRGIKAVTHAEPPAPKDLVTAAAFAGLGRAAEEVLHKVASSERFEKDLQRKLERAGWPMRASEFMLIQAGAGVAGLILGWALSGRWYAGVAAGVVAAVAPMSVLSRRIAKRQHAFLRQLPDTLQLLSGSLQAGYGFLQAIDTLVQECPEPTATEFGRVLAEARLGLPLEDAMEAMAERVGSEDFRWVVMAITIQRQVGGNLADLLRTVAATLREREGVRRQIRTLSAEGRLSAMILAILPFAIAGYIMYANPGYLKDLVNTSSGKAILAGAGGLMLAGMAWLRKIIRIDV